MSPDDFAQQFFTILRITDSKRYSDRDGDLCFDGSAAGIQFSVTSRSPIPDYPFWISIGLDDSAQAAEYLTEHAKVLAWRFVRAGWRCLIPSGDARKITSEADGVVYGAKLQRESE